MNGDAIVKKQDKKIFLSLMLLIAVFCIVFTFVFSTRIFAINEKEIQVSSEDTIFYENKNPIDLEEILNENIKLDIKEEMVVEEIDLEYTTIYKNNSNLPKGTIQVVQEGRDGRQNVIIIKKYENAELVSEELVAENLVKASVNKIVEIGTGSGTNNYKVKIGDALYVTSNSLAIRLEPDKDSEKLCTIKKDTEVKVLKIEESWYYISCTEQKGYIPSDCVTNINPDTNINYEDISQYSSSELIKRLSFDMNLNIKSDLSLEQFKKVLSGNSSDKNGIFENNAEYFYYSEKQYNVNGIFLAAVAIHESGWGTSSISKVKNNLFGYGAYDSNPSGGAYIFSSYSEGIDLVARVFVKYYLNSSGTSIYDSNLADGKYYNGSNLSSVNIKYASDKNWANSVYKWMQYLYNRL